MRRLSIQACNSASSAAGVGSHLRHLLCAYCLYLPKQDRLLVYGRVPLLRCCPIQHQFFPSHPAALHVQVEMQNGFLCVNLLPGMLLLILWGISLSFLGWKPPLLYRHPVILLVLCPPSPLIPAPTLCYQQPVRGVALLWIHPIRHIQHHSTPGCGACLCAAVSRVG
jgi:hypothetical protein